MHVLLDFPWENAEDWLAEMRRQAPHHDLHRWPDIDEPGLIEAAVVWTPAADLFKSLTRLRAIVLPGAGVDQLWRHSEIPPDIPIVRLADPVMASRMAEYVLSMVLDHHRGFARYRRQQADLVWRRHHHADPGDIQVGVMGLGVMGGAVVRHLAAIGYDVIGWSRRLKAIDGVQTLAGDDAFHRFLGQSQILVCTLPLTPQTKGLLNEATFSKLPDDSLVINVARGDHLVVPDLLQAIDDGKLSGAVLDVFRDEPLPPESPLWHHPRITITPHVASLSNPITGVKQIVHALDIIEAGDMPDHVVDRKAGY